MFTAVLAAVASVLQVFFSKHKQSLLVEVVVLAFL